MLEESPPQFEVSEERQQPEDTLSPRIAHVPLADVLLETVKRIQSPVFLASIAVLVIVVLALFLVPDIMDKMPALPYVMLGFGLLVILIVVSSAYAEARAKARERALTTGPPPAPPPVAPPEPKPSAPGDPQRRYLRWLHDNRVLVTLAGIDRQEGDITRQGMTLQKVYTKLNTEQRAFAGERYRGAAAARPFEREQMGRERETRPLPALEAIAAEQRAVLLGGPGSGKSTLVNYLTLCLSGHLLKPQAGWLAKLQPEWDGGSPLPVPIVLRDFAAWLSTDTERGRADLVARYLRHLLEEADAAAYADDLLKTIGRGRALLLFDGLDEVPTGRRGVVRDSVRAFADGCGCRTLVTCRTLSYSDEEWQLPGWPDYRLAVFDREQIDAFITSWYDEVVRLGRKTRAEADDLADGLRRTLDDGWDEFQPLAEIPLLMTLMAIVHTSEGKLPDSRVRLYDRCVELLLWRWEEVKRARRGEQPAELGLLRDLNQPGVDKTALEQTLWRIAYDAHAEQGARPGVADIPASKLAATLYEYLGLSTEQVDVFLNYCRERSGLLLYSGSRRPEGALKPVAIYTFPHRTFQEYLAARHLASGRNFPSTAAEHATRGDQWREVVLLGVEWKRWQGESDTALDVARALCPAERPAREDEAGWRCAWLAGEAALALGTVVGPRRREAEELRARIARRLADLLEAGVLDVRERFAAGEELARLGDPRFSGPYLLPEFVEIPAGEFWMGSEIYDDEKPVHSVYVEEFAIARYPVTNAQYAVFVHATGREPPRHWEGKEPPPHLANHPVVNVSWHDAVDYCRWLSRETGREYRLPSEAEWERAARGAADRREWPWGDEWDAERCNSAEGGPGTTTPVGIYPAGSSPEGVLDMAGNVWEWCSSLYKPYPYDPGDGREDLEVEGSRVLRGGSWLLNQTRARCAYRNGSRPGYWNVNVGFRCARVSQ
ncbi:MAG: SUMF1/EgtB/PvdO family nonheme iron enzyme [Anaerolineae bacterium]